MPDNLIRAFPASIRALTVERDVLLTKLLERGIEIAEGEQPFFWDAEISSNRLDAYYSRMHVSTLKRFAKDAQAGVSFLDSHDSRKLGFGQSLDGRFISEDEELKRVIASFYTFAGINFGGQHSYNSTDDFIKAVRFGLAQDVSVGFWGGSDTCDICGDEIWGWFTNCPHLPGVEYEVDEQQVLCTSTIRDAELVEVSAVYDGATPEAMILKANDLSERGLLNSQTKLAIEKRYKFDIRNPAKTLPVKKQQKGSNDMPFEETFSQRTQDVPGDSPEAKLDYLLRAEQEAERVRVYNDDLSETLAAAQEEIARLSPLADMGNKYRQDQIDLALAEGVRAFGDSFQVETYTNMFESLSLEQIERMLADWRLIGEQALPAGRQTKDELPPEDPETIEIDTVPASAFAA